MSLISRIALAAALSWLGMTVFWDLRAHQQMENASPSRLVTSFAALIIIGMIVALILATSIVPALGDWAGGYFFAPSEPAVQDPHATAVSKMSQGDYAAAIAEYRAAFEKNPNDTMALSEMSRIYCEKLHDSEGAAAVLEEALQREWPQEQVAFLGNRLAEIYWNYQNDAERARALLTQIAETVPGKRY